MPLAFGLGLRDGVVLQMLAAAPDVELLAILDDIYVSGPAASVALAARVYLEVGPTVGLHANVKKFVAAGAPTALALLPPSVAMATRSEVSDSSGFIALKVPIGGHSYSRLMFASVVDKALVTLHHLATMEDTHVALFLLRACATGCKLIGVFPRRC